MNKRANQKGFTLIELIISAGIFSTILLICTAGVIYVGRLFYKGITSSATQEVARSAIEQISSDFELSGGYFVDVSAPPKYGFCIGSHLYSYKNDQLITSGGVGNAFVVRDYANCDTTPPAAPDDVGTGNGYTPGTAVITNVSSQWRELLGPNMRMQMAPPTPFPISQPQTLSLKLIVISGDATYTSGTSCKGEAGSQFCATSELTTYVVRRLR